MGNTLDQQMDACRSQVEDGSQEREALVIVLQKNGKWYERVSGGKRKRDRWYGMDENGDLQQMRVPVERKGRDEDECDPRPLPQLTQFSLAHSREAILRPIEVTTSGHPIYARAAIKTHIRGDTLLGHIDRTNISEFVAKGIKRLLPTAAPGADIDGWFYGIFEGLEQKVAVLCVTTKDSNGKKSYVGSIVSLDGDDYYYLVLQQITCRAKENGRSGIDPKFWCNGQQVVPTQYVTLVAPPVTPITSY